MKIIGLHDGHNASACLMIDGKIRMAIQEERLRREKNYAGFPAQSLDFIFKECGLSLDDIEAFAVVGQEMPDQNTRESRLAMYREVGQPGYYERVVQKSGFGGLKKGLKAGIRKVIGPAAPASEIPPRLRKIVEYGIPKNKIHVFEHHLAHAASAYYGLGVCDKDILILTNDGEGDGVCATVNIGRNGVIERVASVPRSESIGNLYAVVTFLMGMVPLEHEFKLMGMAPYADEKRSAAVAKKFRDLFTFDGVEPYGWHRAARCPDLFYSYSFIRDLLELDRFDSICGGLQKFTEQMLLQWVNNCISATNIHHLALGGGVFMNVKLNKAIMELPDVESLFVFPSCSDETIAIGAAYLMAAKHEGYDKIALIQDLYFGASYSNDAVKAACDNFHFSDQVSCTYVADIETRIVELLTQGQVVARFKGREEFGARALGNRSILADPSNPDVIKVINNMIKCRDFWMPFATSMTDRQAEKCLVNPKRVSAPYMILTFDSTDLIKDFKAGAHPYDLTVRPQIVYRDWNPDYYRLIEQFQMHSGKCGGVLNTSFNLHGYPLVSTPNDALDVFNRSGLKHLAIENYLLSKSKV